MAEQPIVNQDPAEDIDPSELVIVKEAAAKRRLSPQVIIAWTAFTDVLITVFTGYALFLLHIDPSRPSAAFYPGMIATAGVMVAMGMYAGRLYRFLAILNPNPRLRRMVAVIVGAFVALIVLNFALKLSDQFSRLWLLAWACSCVLLIPTARYCIGRLMGRFAAQGRISHNIAIYGTGPLAEKFLQRVLFSHHRHNRIVGIFDQRKQRRPDELVGERVLGGLIDLGEFVRRQEVDQIVVALPSDAESRILELRKSLMRFPVDIGLAPGPLSYALDTSRSSIIDGLPVVELGRRPITGWQYILKRLMDLSIASAACLVAAPLVLIIAAWIKLDSPGPILFRQQRYGFNNKLIEVFKFRTMYIDQQDDHAARLATRDDPRITRVGAFLRRWSLDELPQLLNVVGGQMSLVGPRPHATLAKAADTLYTELLDDYASRHRVKPGITGLAQVRGWRGETDTHEKLIKRVESDLEYIDSWSLTLDVRIMMRTVWSVIEGENAH